MRRYFCIRLKKNSAYQKILKKPIYITICFPFWNRYGQFSNTPFLSESSLSSLLKTPVKKLRPLLLSFGRHPYIHLGLRSRKPILISAHFRAIRMDHNIQRVYDNFPKASLAKLRPIRIFSPVSKSNNNPRFYENIFAFPSERKIWKNLSILPFAFLSELEIFMHPFSLSLTPLCLLYPKPCGSISPSDVNKTPEVNNLRHLNLQKEY